MVKLFIVNLIFTLKNGLRNVRSYNIIISLWRSLISETTLPFMQTHRPLNSNSNLISKLIHVYIHTLCGVRDVNLSTHCGVLNTCAHVMHWVIVLSSCGIHFTHFQPTRLVNAHNKPYKNHINEFVIPKILAIQYLLKTFHLLYFYNAEWRSFVCFARTLF